MLLIVLYLFLLIHKSFLIVQVQYLLSPIKMELQPKFKSLLMIPIWMLSACSTIPSLIIPMLPLSASHPCSLNYSSLELPTLVVHHLFSSMLMHSTSMLLLRWLLTSQLLLWPMLHLLVLQLVIISCLLVSLAHLIVTLLNNLDISYQVEFILN